LIMSSDKTIFKRLTLRMIVPVVMVVTAVGIGFYLSVLRTLSEYAEKDIRASLSRTAKEIYDICDNNFTALLQSGQIGNPKIVRIKRALTIGTIEDYAKRNNLRLLLQDSEQQVLITYQADAALLAYVNKTHQKDPIVKLRISGKIYYFHHFDFKPWEWHIDLISDTTPFSPLINRVKAVYVLTAIFLLLGISAIILVLERGLRKPVQQIISAVREKHPPEYRGIHEFEFLSQNIAQMMTSLKERTQLLERLYTIGTIRRGEIFFHSIAQAIADATGLNTVITKVDEECKGFRIVAVGEAEGYRLQVDELLDGLPCELLINRSEPTLVRTGASEQFSEFKGIVANRAECYIGLAITDRKGRTIGCAHLFGNAREMDDWDMNIVKTVGRMAGSEFELMDKEQEQERIREQMFRSQKLESLGMLAGGVAHDFNNLLMGIQGRASMVLDEGETSQSVSEHVQAIEEYITRASELTSQLLGFARGGKYDSKPTDINVVLDHSAKMFGRTKKEIVIHTEFAKDLPAVEIDRRQIEQVLLNLFVNAWHAMPGGGNLKLMTENVLIDETYAELHGCTPGRFTKISVIDTGAGMDEATIKKIFDPFFTTRKMGRGTGLGLAMVYGIIKNHGGMITVHSTVGKGSTFAVYLPASDQTPQPETPRAKTIVEGKETILLVDDEQMIINVASAMLKKLGYRIIVANGGHQALEAMERTGDDIDLVILDLIMPDLAGGEVFERLREIRPEVPVMISSGYSIDGEAKAIMDRGCNGFIQKPFNMSELSRKIRSILDTIKASPLE